MSMDISIRRAQPDDIDFAVPLIYSSGPHEFDYIFNLGQKTALGYLSFAYPTKLGSQSHRVCTVATLNNKVVGIGSFYTSRDYTRLGFGNFWNVLKFFGPQNLLKISQRTSRIETIIPAPEADTGFISQLGVAEEFRGYGIGTALIRHFIERARALGLRKCVLDVAMTNSKAQALYERLGFRVIQESKWRYSHPKIHVPGQRRMELIV